MPGALSQAPTSPTPQQLLFMLGSHIQFHVTKFCG